MSRAAISPSRFLVLCAVSITIAILLGECYQFVQHKTGQNPWRAALIAHLVLALIFTAIRKPVREALQFRGGSIIAYVPAFLVLIGAYLLANSGGHQPTGFQISSRSELIYIVCTLTIIPLVEEMVFRTGISPFLNRLGDGWWSIWFSALVFSIAHTNPSFERVMSLSAGVPLGPFLLGICCDFIVRRWGRLWPAVFFHASCNATVYIFSSLNPSWLDRLGHLYM
jgi:membrane protease YdiL (CAAX protease family)